MCVNDRWGLGTASHHGDFFNHADKFNPGYLLPHKWENAMTLDKGSWGYRRQMKAGDVLSLLDLITSLASTVACGGNMLLNVGPTHYGRLAPIFEQRLRNLGDWLTTNGAAIYGSKPWIHQNDTLTKNIWYTSQVRSAHGLDPRRIHNPQDESNTIVYAIFLKWPQTGLLKLASPTATSKTQVSMLGLKGNSGIRWKFLGGQMQIDLSGIQWPLLNSSTAWVLRLEYLATSSRDPWAETAKLLRPRLIAA